MDFPEWVSSSFAVSLHHLKVLPFDLYLAWGVLHTVDETVDSRASMGICLDHPVNIRVD